MVQKRQCQQQRHQFSQQRRPSGPAETVIIIQQSNKAKEQQSNKSGKKASKGPIKIPKRQTEKKEMNQPDLEESRKSSPVVNKAKNQDEASKQPEDLASKQATATKHQAPLLERKRKSKRKRERKRKRNHFFHFSWEKPLAETGLAFLVQQARTRRTNKQARKMGISLTRPMVLMGCIWATSRSILKLQTRTCSTMTLPWRW